MKTHIFMPLTPLVLLVSPVPFVPLVPLYPQGDTHKEQLQEMLQQLRDAEDRLQRERDARTRAETEVAQQQVKAVALQQALELSEASADESKRQLQEAKGRVEDAVHLAGTLEATKAELCHVQALVPKQEEMGFMKGEVKRLEEHLQAPIERLPYPEWSPSRDLLTTSEAQACCSFGLLCADIPTHMGPSQPSHGDCCTNQPTPRCLHGSAVVLSRRHYTSDSGQRGTAFLVYASD